ncbi:MAG: hypothetical protein JXA82_05650 [Sedimentisphaerales bacterium]|nr:hypothetical protein [Sedimentisphaerales bacterium]
MELTWRMRLRIVAAMGVGILLLGLIAQPLIMPTDPERGITLFGDSVSIPDMAVCIALAFASGLIGFFLAYPYGWYVAPLAAPAGLCFWTLRSGNMLSLIRANSTLAQRQLLYSSLSREGFFWLAIVVAGYAGVFVGRAITRKQPPDIPGQDPANSKGNNVVNILAALVISVIIGQIALGIFAQGVRIFDAQIGSVVAQPGNGQIAFAVFVAFGLAAWFIKRFLDVNYVVTVISSAIVVYVVIVFVASKPDVLGHMVDNYPAAFFPRPVCAILPIQMVSWAALGSVAGYWTAVKMEYHRKNDLQ